METDFLTADEVAERMRVDTQTVHKWRREGVGPPFMQVKKGATVLYPRDRLEAWEREQITTQA